MTNYPKVSCVIPTYNREETIERAIESVLKQTHIPEEIIIVDDGSTDATADILKNYSSKMTLIYQNNQGVSSARNLGIQQSTGDWVAFLDSDDQWHPQKIEKQCAFIDKNPRCCLLQTEEIWIRNGRRVNPKKKHQKKSGHIFKESLSLCLISPSAVMIRKTVFDKLGLFDKKLSCCEDYDFWLRACLYYSIDLLFEKLTIKYGGHRDQLSRTTPMQDVLRIQSMENLFHNYSLTQTQKKDLFLELITKMTIVLNGAKKRKNKTIEGYYQKKLNDYKQLLERCEHF